MPKLTKAFDYYVKGSKMVSYPKGYDGEMPEAHLKAAKAAGAVEEAKTTGGAASGGAGGTK